MMIGMSIAKNKDLLNLKGLQFFYLNKEIYPHYDHSRPDPYHPLAACR